MIRRLVTIALNSPSAVVIAVLALILAGLISYERLDIEAYPNPVPPLVELITQPEGWSAEEVERQITIPLEVTLAGMPGLEHIRSQSLFGLSDVKCYFGWGTDYKDARQEVINRLQFVTLPNGLQAQISPWNAIGEVFRYIVRGKGYTIRDLKTAQDWILEREFRRVPGVIDVTSYGGETKEYHVDVDPYRLRGQGVTLGQLTAALPNANQNVGGQRVSLGEQSYDVRGLGLFRSIHDIEQTVVQTVKGVPVRIRDVANVVEGARPRLGIVGHDNESDVVQGIILMRYGGETGPTLEAIHQRIKYIRESHLLPPGMDIEPYYDRGELVQLTTHTVMENLLLGMLLVTIVLLFFLGNARGALIAAVNIPLSLLVAFCGMVATGTPANLISLGAVDFGIIVDSTVIVVENIFRHLGSHGTGSMRERVLSAVGEVGMPLGFSRLIIFVTFLPLFTMTGVSGVIFAPMAHTYAFAIGGAAILALMLSTTRCSTSRFATRKARSPLRILAVRGSDSPDHSAAPRGRDRGVAARPPGRWNGCVGLRQHRAVCAAQALRQLAGRPDQGEADRSTVGGAQPGLPWSRLRLLADDLGQRGGAVSGVKGENSVKIVGPDLRTNHEIADSVSDVLSDIRGIKDVGLFSSLGQPNITIAVDRSEAARYGLNTGDIETVIQAAIGGQAVTQVFEGEKRFDVVVRWLEPYRRTVEAIRQITVATPDGSQIPLGQVAKIELVDGPSVIYREDGRRYAPVKFSVRGRDLASAIGEASAAITSKVKIPYGTRLDWAGEINELHEAEGRLLVIIPITIGLIAFLVYSAVKDWLFTAVVLLNIPVACAGGLLALLLTGINFSVSAAMGFVSIFGVAIQDAILMVTYAQAQWSDGRSVEEGAKIAAEQRFRPVLMTTLVAMLGLFPAAVSHGIGAQTQKPLAVVVIGGSFVLAGLTRVLQPPLLVLAHRWRERWTTQPGPVPVPQIGNA